MFFTFNTNTFNTNTFNTKILFQQIAQVILLATIFTPSFYTASRVDQPIFNADVDELLEQDKILSIGATVVQGSANLAVNTVENIRDIVIREKIKRNRTTPLAESFLKRSLVLEEKIKDCANEAQRLLEYIIKQETTDASYLLKGFSISEKSIALRAYFQSFVEEFGLRDIFKKIYDTVLHVIDTCSQLVSALKSVYDDVSQQEHLVIEQLFLSNK